MKNKFMLCLLAIVSIFSTIFGNVQAVQAETNATLAIEHVDNVYYLLDGGDLGKRTLDQFSNFYMNGEVVYCIEPYTSIKTNDYVGEGGYVHSPYDEITNKKIELIGHYGYEYPGHQTQNFRLATQALIWEAVTGQNTTFSTELLGSEIIDVSYEKSVINNLINNHYTQPSFNNESIQLTINETTTITDTNGVLSGYQVMNANGAEVSIQGNDLIVTPTSVSEIQIQLVRKNYDHKSTFVFTNHYVDTQILGYFRFSDPIVARLNLDIYGGEVIITKLDSETLLSEPQGEATLQGAEYGIYQLDGTLVKTIITDENANASSGQILGIGSYYLQEIKPSEGYELDDTKYFFDITADNLEANIAVYEDIIRRDVELNKFYASGETGMLKPEVGIEFGFYNNKDELVTTVFTDGNGYAKANIVYGTYTVKQHTTTDGHEKVDDFQVSITGDSPQVIKYSMSNAVITAKLRLQKVDSESGQTIAYAGVEFKIKDLTTNEYITQIVSYPSQEEINIFKTNEFGEFMTPYPLTAGTYQIEEISSPSGYLLSNTPVTFTIDENSEILEDEYGKYISVVFNNDKIKGKLTINKQGEVPIFSDSGVVYEEIQLSDVEFGVYAKEDIVTLDGVQHYSKDELITTVITDENGTAKVDNMLLGSYYVKELKTSPNHVLDESIYEFTLSEVDNQTSIVYETLNLTNKHKKGDLEFTKTDFATGEAIPNTIIEIYNDKDMLLFTRTTDENGKVVIEELPIGKYYIKEYEAATGYLLTEEIVEFEILEDGEIIKAEMTNKPITGTLEFTKVDFSTSQPLPNTVIEIYDDKDTLIFTGTTDEFGKIVIEELRYGKYYILEKDAPDGYILNTERMYFEILEDGEIVKTTMTNQRVVVDVPDTAQNTYYGLEILSGIFVISGIGIIIYGFRRQKRRMKK